MHDVQGSKMTEDLWRSVFQQLPINLHERFKVQLRRVALANGIAAEYFDGDSKFAQIVGPKVQTWECLILLLERTEKDEYLRV